MTQEQLTFKWDDELDPFKYHGLDPAKPHLGGYCATPYEQGTYCPAVWARILKDHPDIEFVTDVGSGLGPAAKWFREHGCYAWEVDGTPQDRAWFTQHDYTESPLILHGDLVWSAEFVEHVAPEFEDNFLKTFECHPYVCMTHAKPGDVGYHHVNCQESDYWIRRLGEWGFEYDDEYSKLLRSFCRKDESETRCVRDSLLWFYRE